MMKNSPELKTAMIWITMQMSLPVFLPSSRMWPTKISNSKEVKNELMNIFL